MKPRARNGFHADIRDGTLVGSIDGTAHERARITVTTIAANKKAEANMNRFQRLSRRAILGIAALAAVSIGTEEQAVAQFKTTKRIAKYQSTPKGKQRCALCRHFKPPNHCQIVDGEISPNGWCRFFVAKQ